MGEIDVLRERLRQARDARRRELVADAGQTYCPELALNCTHQPGARVFDRVTGQEGVIIGGTRENLVGTVARRGDD